MTASIAGGSLTAVTFAARYNFPKKLAHSVPPFDIHVLCGFLLFSRALPWFLAVYRAENNPAALVLPLHFRCIPRSLLHSERVC